MIISMSKTNPMKLSLANFRLGWLPSKPNGRWRMRRAMGHLLNFKTPCLVKIRMFLQDLLLRPLQRQMVKWLILLLIPKPKNLLLLHRNLPGLVMLRKNRKPSHQLIWCHQLAYWTHRPWKWLAIVNREPMCHQFPLLLPLLSRKLQRENFGCISFEMGSDHPVIQFSRTN